MSNRTSVHRRVKSRRSVSRKNEKKLGYSIFSNFWTRFGGFFVSIWTHLWSLGKSSLAFSYRLVISILSRPVPKMSTQNWTVTNLFTLKRQITFIRDICRTLEDPSFTGSRADKVHSQMQAIINATPEPMKSYWQTKLENAQGLRANSELALIRSIRAQMETELMTVNLSLGNLLN